MSADPNLRKSAESESASYKPSQAFLDFLQTEIDDAEDFHKNLKTSYAASVYKEFEDKFIALRRRFKDKLQLYSDADRLFLNHAELRKQEAQKIIECATRVAERFQQARENNRLDYARSTDALEDLINAIKNLKELSERVR